MSDLAAVHELAAALLQSIAPAARRQLLRRIAREIRKTQSDRIGRQLQPDGSRFAPRKSAGDKRRKGQLREKVMFRKLRLAKSLKAGADASEAWVGFAGRAASIARVHQDGLEDAPVRGGKKVRYSRRVLLGLTNAEERTMLDHLLAAVSA